MAINKVVYGADTLLDLTEDTVTAEDVLNSKSFHTSDGVKRTGTASYPVTDVQVNGTSVMDGTVAKVVQPTADEQTATDEFTTINGGILSSLKVALTPNQDLHGYDSPWVGGASKNKINCNAPTVTNNGVTVTNNGDGTFTATGTATGQTDFYLTNSGSSDLIPLGDITDGYLVNGCPSGGGTSSYQLVIGSLNSRYATDSGNGDTLTNVLQNGIRVILRVYSNYSFPTGGLTFKPMIRASGTSADFEPYENICPISGHTQAVVGDDGKNRFDDNAKTLGAYLTIYGATSGSGASDVTDYILIKSSNAVSFSFKYDSLSSGNTRIVCFYDKNKQFTEYTQYVPTDADKYKKVTFTPTNPDSVYIRITLDKGAKEIQVELGSTATAYEPYNGYRVTVNLGGTYYSGILDVVTGVLSIDGQILTNLENGTWQLNSTATVPYFYSTSFRNIGIDIANRGDVISDSYKSAPVTNSNTEDGIFSFSGDGDLRIRNTSYGSDINTFKASLSGMIIWFPLATPTPIQLSPTMVKALVGENHLSAPLDGQEITESKYRQLFTWDEVEEIAQKIADSKIDDVYTSSETTFSSYTIQNRYARKVWDVPLLTPYYQKSSGATEVTFNNSFIYNDYQTSCELIQIGSGPRVGVSNVAITSGSVTFTFDAPLTADTRFACSIMNFY